MRIKLLKNRCLLYISQILKDKVKYNLEDMIQVLYYSL